MTLIKSNNSLITNWFQKPISSVRLINFSSSYPIQYIGNVYNLIDRAILLSDTSFHKDNIYKVKKMLLKNGFPLDFIEKNIKTWLNKIKFQTTCNNNIEQIFTNEFPKILFL